MTRPEPGPETERPGRAVHIGSVTGSAFAVGDHNEVSTVNGLAAGPPAAEEQTAALLTAVRELRADLARLTSAVTQRTEVAVLDAELVAVEEEIEAGDAVATGRLARLRAALVSAAPVVELLASGGAVATAVAALLGG
ncbi:hypothetical protein [Streptomyces sp. NRRL S-118]|uniref:hypothetical protein n=1 Tax=Streptomyces sp. NRRL S-118 TaxID=1463881 RepID=UPI0004C64973|nr:hypothetical protein [Streptomyces sp. NRRL S-118]